jgi:nitroimidazol reductase NimA-like FMN-containing flavoprotein (pyridoxamine 5'-phosphate oxidase superfamily)
MSPGLERRDEAMLDKMKELIRRMSSCVLATTDGTVPHCSLMAYTVDHECENFYLATPRDTLKYRNICHHPHVSLLIDTRGETEQRHVMALTVAGECKEVSSEKERKVISKRFSAKHPHLESFLQKHEIAFVRVVIKKFLLLDGPDQSHHEKVGYGSTDT